MRYSQAQLDLWKIRDQLDRELEGLNAEQLAEHYAKLEEKLARQYGDTLEFVPAAGGRRHIRVA